MAKLIQTLLSDNIDARLDALGMTPREASLKTGRGPDVIRNIKRAAESGRDYNPRADTMRLLADVLETTPDWLLTNLDGKTTVIEAKAPVYEYRAPPELLGERDLDVFSSVEGGPGEMMVFSTDPYEVVQRPWYVDRDPDAFGVFLTGDSMEPVYEAGEIIIVSPRAPLVKGKEAVFTADPTGGDFRASLKRYRGLTQTHWLAKQFNPEQDLQFERDVWRKAYRVLGSFDG